MKYGLRASEQKNVLSVKSKKASQTWFEWLFYGLVFASCGVRLRRWY